MYKFAGMKGLTIKIFTAENTSRLKYIADLLLNEILGLKCEIVTDRRRLGKFPVINYSDIDIPGSFRVIPVPLLFETGVRQQDLTVRDWRGLPVFFGSSADADLPFDIFAASFYLVSRYEEYLKFTPDQYGRFRSADSAALINGFLDIPVVDFWTREMANSLVRKFQILTFRRNEYRALVTFDIDEPFAYLGKNFIGNISGFLHDITTKSGKPGRRLGCLTHGEKDPFEVFDYMTRSAEQNNTLIKFFFPVGNHSEFDKNPSWKNEIYRNLIRKVSERFSVGLHPSCKASGSYPLVRTELQRINTINGKECHSSRFHFLKISMPDSFRNLNKAGIREDYSMGFPDECGFRAGIARPFNFYDVIDDRMTDLRIFPFQVMDVTLTDYKKHSAEEAGKIIGNLILQTKKAGGLFISIWHNTTLLDTPDCRGWRDLFEFTLKEQMP